MLAYSAEKRQGVIRCQCGNEYSPTMLRRRIPLSQSNQLYPEDERRSIAFDTLIRYPQDVRLGHKTEYLNTGRSGCLTPSPWQAKPKNVLQETLFEPDSTSSLANGILFGVRQIGGS
jgi:hypothetical protein